MGILAIETSIAHEYLIFINTPRRYTMKFGKNGLSALATLSVLCLGLTPALAQTKPPESASKLKKVLVYNKIGGFVHMHGIAEVKEVFSKLSAAKGFEVVQLQDDTVITLDYLKQFQVIVWNNNTDGAKSVPSSIARQAVLDYLDQGGGWMLICNAGDHSDSWAGLKDRMGAKFVRHAKSDRGEVVMDEDAMAHRELKWMAEGFPDVFELKDEWLTFNNTVRPLPGVTVVATARGIPGVPGVVMDVGDGSGDNVFIWAREVERGRLIYNATGFGQIQDIMEQQDSIVPRFYWENLRYLAGDYQNGCTTPASPGFDPAARVHVEAMCSPTSLKAVPASSHLLLSKGNIRMRTVSPEGALRVRLRDLRGMVVWESALPAGTREITLDAAIKPGVYHFEVRGESGSFQRRLALP
jgi:hypothetical protein